MTRTDVVWENEGGWDDRHTFCVLQWGGQGGPLTPKAGPLTPKAGPLNPKAGPLTPKAGPLTPPSLRGRPVRSAFLRWGKSLTHKATSGPGTQENHTHFSFVLRELFFLSRVRFLPASCVSNISRFHFLRLATPLGEMGMGMS